jgi:hypothetical protein
MIAEEEEDITRLNGTAKTILQVTVPGLRKQDRQEKR